VIQKKMKLDGSFGPSEFGPIKDFQAQIDGGRIHGDQFVFKPKRFLPDDLNAASFKEPKEELLIELPGAVLIGIGQGGMAWSGDAQMFQLPLAASKASANLTERMGTTQLAKQHGYKLAPAGKPFGITFGMGLFHHVLKLDSWKQL
jgi:hypothetical protein